MEDIKQYLLTVTAASILCGILVTLLGKKSASGSIVKVLCGLFLSVSVVAPWAKIQLLDLATYTDNLQLEASQYAANGENTASEELAAIINQQTQAYILDKADSLGLDIAVEVTLNDQEPPVPYTVVITGSAAPYAKEVLSQFIANDLSVPKERQKWSK